MLFVGRKSLERCARADIIKPDFAVRRKKAADHIERLCEGPKA